MRSVRRLRAMDAEDNSSAAMKAMSGQFLVGSSDEASRAVWEFVEYMVDTFTFLLSRVIIAVNLRASEVSGSDVLDLPTFTLSAWPPAPLRFFFYPLLSVCLSLDFQDAVLTCAAGLRGGMAMIVHFSARDGHPLEETDNGSRLTWETLFLDDCRQYHGVHSGHTSLSLPQARQSKS